MDHQSIIYALDEEILSDNDFSNSDIDSDVQWYIGLIGNHKITTTIITIIKQ